MLQVHEGKHQRFLPGLLQCHAGQHNTYPFNTDLSPAELEGCHRGTFNSPSLILDHGEDAQTHETEDSRQCFDAHLDLSFLHVQRRFSSPDGKMQVRRKNQRVR